MAQLTYETNFRVGILGNEAEELPSKKGTAKNAQGADIPFGVAVARSGNSDIERVLPTSGSDEIIGVALNTFFQDNRSLSNDDGIKDDDYFTEMYEGVIWVKPEVAVQPGEPVFVRHTANGGNTQLGAFRNDADTSNAVQIRGRWRSSALAGELAKLELFNPLT